MNKKELAEIRRRVRPDRTNIQHIYGCYVNTQKEIIARIDESMGLLSTEEQEKYISLLKKSLSGSLGKNLMDLSFSTKQVMDSDEHRLLSALRKTELKDPELLEEFYKCVTENLEMDESNYLVLIAFDVYDVPQYGKNGEKDDQTRDLFRYLICAVCPVKTGKPVLSFSNEESRFHNLSMAQVVSQPEIGFMFPAFDDRSANIYNALFYTRNTKGMHSDFIDAVFKTEVPLSAGQQKEAFGSALKGSLEKDCSLEVVQSVHEQLREKIELHKESKNPEQLTVSPEEMAEILEKSGVDENKRRDFVSGCRELMGEKAELKPENIINSKKFEISTESVKIKIDPDFSSLVRTEMIDGRKYILIPAEGAVEVNGIDISL